MKMRLLFLLVISCLTNNEKLISLFVNYNVYQLIKSTIVTFSLIPKRHSPLELH